MSLTLNDAEQIVLKNLGEGTTIGSGIEHEGMFLFIAYRSDPLEGRFDPFFSVNPSNGFFRDFSPGDYPEPVKVINALNAALRT